MEGLDIAIFRELVQESTAAPVSADPTRSLRSIAKRLDVDKDTVRTRIARLRGQRFLQAPLVFPNPALVGLAVDQHWVDTRPGRRAAVADRLKRRGDVLVVSEHLGEALTYLRMRDAAGRAGKTPGPGVARDRSAPLPFPKPAVELTAGDWRVAEALAQDPEAGTAGVAKAIGVAPRTATRRIQRLVEGRAIFVIPRFDPRALDGTVVDLALFYASGAHKAAADRQVMGRLAESLFHADLGDPGHSFFNFIVNNVAAASGTLAWARDLPGVEEARADFVVGRTELVENLWARVDERRAGAARRAGPQPPR